ncbi:MAG: DUF3120 domain-containing protein [Microcoleus sp.]
MFNFNLLSSAIAPIFNLTPLENPVSSSEKRNSLQQWLIFGASAFLVSIPVFVQAPLVRLYPTISLLSTIPWFVLSLIFIFRPKTQLWGDLLLGFAGCWLAGSIYWGWFRWEPILHLPIEAIGLPFAIWCLGKSWGKVGAYFYLGSLFGTAITDLYFYLTGLMPYWRQVMHAEPELAMPIFQSAIGQIETPWGIGWALVLIAVLLSVGLVSLRDRTLHWRAFSGAVLSTLLVDGLFWLAASAA